MPSIHTQNILGSLVRKIAKIPVLFKSFSLLLNPKKWGPFVEIARTTRFDHDISVSWSQGGEDLALLHYLPKIGFYIDVGAHHPSRFSVTRHLYQKGWRGLNIDANPDLQKSFLKMRPDDTFLNICVGLAESYTFSIFEEPALSTSVEGSVARYISQGQNISKVITVQGKSLFSIILEYVPDRVDLLVVDAEGADLEVMESLNLETLDRNLFPRWIVSEISPPVFSVQESDLSKYLTLNGYELFMVLPMSSIFRLTDV